MQKSILPVRFKHVDILNDELKSIDYCYVSTHDYCSVILKKISDLIDAKLDIPEKLTYRFFHVIVRAIECWSLNYDINLKRVSYIFENYDLDDELITLIFKTENSEVIHLYLEKNKDMNNNLLTRILNIINKHNINIGNSFDIIIENILKIQNQENMNILFDNSVKTLNINLINKLLDFKYKPSTNSFIKLLINLKDEPIDVIKKCIYNGIQIEKNFINLYTYEIFNGHVYNIYHFYDIIIYLYDNGANEINFNNFVKCQYAIEKTKFTDTINYLIDNNCLLTKNDFIELCKNNIKIKNIKNIQKYFDDKDVQTVIFESNLNYPVNITFTLDMLKNECKKKSNLKKIQEICKVIKPDIICLENACSVQNNMSVIKYLHDIHKIPFNEKCIIYYVGTIKQNPLLKYIVNKYKKENNMIIDNNILNIDDDNY